MANDELIVTPQVLPTVRKMGTFYKKTIEKLLRKYDCDPVLALVRMIKNLDPDTGEAYMQEVVVGKGDNAHIENIHGFDPSIRLAAAKELASYLHAKKKAIETTTTPDTTYVFETISQSQADAMDKQQVLELEAEFKEEGGEYADEGQDLVEETT